MNKMTFSLRGSDWQKMLEILVMGERKYEVTIVPEGSDLITLSWSNPSVIAEAHPLSTEAKLLRDDGSFRFFGEEV